MKWILLILFSILVIGSVLLSACGAPPTETLPTSPSTEQPSVPPVQTPPTPLPTERQDYTLSISVEPSGAGYVPRPGGQYRSGVRVTLNALPYSGYDFEHWDGDASGSSPIATIIMDSDKSVIAHFAAVTATAEFYPSSTIGGYVRELSFDLHNGPSQAITVIKVEILDEHGNVVFTMSQADMAETWGNGQVDPDRALHSAISLQIPPSLKEIENWQVNWYCLDADGVEFTVEGKYPSLRGLPCCG